MLTESVAEHELLSDGLARLFDLPAVQAEVVPAEAAAIRATCSTGTATDVAVLRFEQSGTGAPEPLDRALGAVRAAGLEIAWCGLLRNSVDDIRRQTPAIVVAGDYADDVRTLLATGSANLLFDEVARSRDPVSRPVRVCIASYEVVGPTKNGGIGTANTSLAELLAAAGHDVTLLYTGCEGIDDQACDHWTRHYAQRNVRFQALASDPRLLVHTPQGNQARAYEFHRWLLATEREQSWDVVHVPECQGHGYYALLARRLGMAFGETTFVVGVHSPTRWVYEANCGPLDSAHRLADDHMERMSVELADVVVGPSAYLLAWMEREGWRLPARRFVQQYATSAPVGRPRSLSNGRSRQAPCADLPDGPGTRAARDFGYEPPVVSASSNDPDAVNDPARGIEEIVFFGRLETRKGLETFCDALDMLADEAACPHVRIAFLGRESAIDGEPAGRYLERRSRAWRWPWRIEADLNQPQAVEYIRQPGRLVVMPSPVDNSPNTVMEALGLGIPFVTSSGGGIPELIHPLDHADSTFEPVDPRADRDAREAAGSRGLADAIDRATRRDGAVRPRFAVDPVANAGVHVAWHERVAGSASSAAPREGAQPVESVSVCISGASDAPSLLASCYSFERQVDVDLKLLVDRGEADDPLPELEGRGWRQISIAEGFGSEADADMLADWLFLADPDSIAEPDLLATLVSAGRQLNGDVVVCGTRLERTADGCETVDIPLGGSASVGLFYDCMGVGGMLIRRSVLAEVGGLPGGRSPEVVRQVLLRRAALAGATFATVPEVLLDRHPKLAGLARPGYSNGDLCDLLAPYESVLPHSLRDLAPVAASLARQPSGLHLESALEARVGALQANLDTVLRSRSWRITEPLRTVASRIRRSGGNG